MTYKPPQNNIPHSIPGHISQDEGLWLSKMAKNRVVLEIGCFRGRSTAYLSSTATHVVTCDSFAGQASLRGDQTPVDFREVEREWKLNIEHLGFSEKATLYSSRSEHAFEEIAHAFGRSFYFMFIDGGHDEKSLRADVLYSSLLENHGVIAFHDYFDSRYPAVKTIVDSWRAETDLITEPFHTINSISAYQILHQ